MTTKSAEIKKALNAHFKAQGKKIKFSVTTRNVCCETITISWVGGASIEEVKAIAKPWDTFVNNSDSSSDYFSYSGTEISYRRDLSQADVEFLTEYVLPDFPVDYEVTFEKCYDSEGFKATIKLDGEYVSRHNSRYEQLDQYNETGAIAEEIPSYIWEKAWAAKAQIEVKSVEEITETKIVNEEFSNVVSFTQFKESKQQKEENQIENDYLELADFLLEMPSNRRTRILKEITESASPTIYVQSLLQSMRTIAASGF